MKKTLLILIALAVTAFACGDNLHPPKHANPTARHLPTVDMSPMHQISVME